MSNLTDQLAADLALTLLDADSPLSPCDLVVWTEADGTEHADVPMVLCEIRQQDTDGDKRNVRKLSRDAMVSNDYAVDPGDTITIDGDDWTVFAVPRRNAAIRNLELHRDSDQYIGGGRTYGED